MTTVLTMRIKVTQMTLTSAARTCVSCVIPPMQFKARQIPWQTASPDLPPRSRLKWLLCVQRALHFFLDLCDMAV